MMTCRLKNVGVIAKYPFQSPLSQVIGDNLWEKEMKMLSNSREYNQIINLTT